MTGSGGGARLLDDGRRPVEPGAIVPGSIRVRQLVRLFMAAESRGAWCLRGRDWDLDEARGLILRAPGSAIPEADPVRVSFHHGLERIDSVQVGPKGEVVLVEGEAAPAGAARPPATRQGHLRLLDIRMPPRGVLLEPEMLHPEGIGGR